MFDCLVVFIVLLIQYTNGRYVSRPSSPFHNRLSQRQQLLNNANEIIIPSSILSIHRGGATRKKTGGKTASLSSKSSSASKTATGKKKVTGSVETQQKKAEQQEESAFGSIMQKYKKMLPLTRIYITMVGVSTALGLVLGEELTQTLLSLDPIRAIYGFELWRPFTAACFLGPPSVGWLMNGYYLFQYGSTLEKAYGSAQHLIFLLSQIITLSILSMLLGQPFFASSMITAMLHVLSRAMPYQNVQWLVFTVPYWSLPYGLMATDVLQAQSAMAAIPHILGILSGHVYQFHKFIWPKLNPGKNEDWLVAPAFIAKKLDPNYKSPADKAKESVSKALKGRKRQKGRRLGSL
jgi:membrane associated rhomboid family serine protease